MDQVETWLVGGDVQRLVVVVAGIDSGETLERWQFNVMLDDDEGIDGENQKPNKNSTSQPAKKSIKEIHGEIQAIIRQITASVTFLPLLNEPCSFDLLVYTKKDAVVPTKWEDSDPCYIMNSQEVKLRSFTTSVSKTFGYVTTLSRRKSISTIRLSHSFSLFLNRFTKSTPWSHIARLMNGNSRKESTYYCLEKLSTSNGVRQITSHETTKGDNILSSCSFYFRYILCIKRKCEFQVSFTFNQFNHVSRLQETTAKRKYSKRNSK